MATKGSVNPSEAAPAPLAVANSRLELSLPLSSPHLVYPGLLIRPVVRVLGDAHYEHMSLRLVAETRVTVMGKRRWLGFDAYQQAGAALNTTLGPGGGVPVSTIERLPFADIPLSQVSPATITGEKVDLSGSPVLDGANEHVFEVQIPTQGDDSLLPSFLQKDHDAAGASVAWWLELEANRKGWYRSNDKLKLDLPVVFPSTSPGGHLETSMTKALKYKGDNASDLSASAALTCETITTRTPHLHFRLTLLPSNPVAQHLLTSNALNPSSSLSRQIRTAPVASPKSGVEHDWAAVRLCMGSLEPAHKDMAGELVWTGELQVPEDEWTVESKGLSVKAVSVFTQNAAKPVQTMYGPRAAPIAGVDYSY
ncbi:hypothetical protein Rhopal_000466-T1 [Rhodotorula paludigena]|uniref:Arrestin-like N-terminal domain-containing protein n=1 Tax=Rhodotorula paludigena TaxID=86838 RepID=A0AAV5G4Z0_9BASI|nr:hypothetical protein Rhopal_000466-T1 [Rhodotorula paludigena]